MSDQNGELLGPSLELSLHLAVGKHHARLKQGCAHHRILDLICGEFRRNDYVGNLYCAMGQPRIKVGLFDPGLADWLYPLATARALHVADARLR
jgi:hypothetical protein